MEASGVYASPCGDRGLSEQRPVVAEERPEHVWHGKGDVLPFAVGQDVLLLSNPLLGRLHAAGAAGL